VALLTASVTLPWPVNLKALERRFRHDLLQPLLVGADRRRQLLVEVDDEIERLVGRKLAEGPLHMLLEARHRHVADLDRDGTGFDLRKIEDVVDEAEKIRTGRVDGPGDSVCFSLRLPCGLSAAASTGSAASSSGVRSSCDMLARNSDLYLEVSASCSAFSSTARRAISISRFLASTCFFSFSRSWPFS
jgi:hypothetical protein